MFLSIPANVIQFFNGSWVILRSKPLNTLPVLRAPKSCNASRLIGRVVSVSVFSVHSLMQYSPSEAKTISFQSSFKISLIRSPVRHENNDADFKTGIGHGVWDKILSSFKVKYSFLESFISILTKNSLMFSFINLSRKAIFNNERKVEK